MVTSDVARPLIHSSNAVRLSTRRTLCLTRLASCVSKKVISLGRVPRTPPRASTQKEAAARFARAKITLPRTVDLGRMVRLHLWFGWLCHLDPLSLFLLVSFLRCPLQHCPELGSAVSSIIWSVQLIIIPRSLLLCPDSSERAITTALLPPSPTRPAGADEDDFHVLKRKHLEVEQEEKDVLDATKKQTKPRLVADGAKRKDKAPEKRKVVAF